MKYTHFSISYKKSKYIIGDVTEDHKKLYTNKYLVDDFDKYDPLQTIENCIYYFISREVMPNQSTTVVGSSIFYVINKVTECKKSNKFVVTIPPEYYDFDIKTELHDLNITIEIDDGTIDLDDYVVL